MIRNTSPRAHYKTAHITQEQLARGTYQKMNSLCYDLYKYLDVSMEYQIIDDGRQKALCATDIPDDLRSRFIDTIEQDNSVAIDDPSVFELTVYAIVYPKDVELLLILDTGLKEYSAYLRPNSSEKDCLRSLVCNAIIKNKDGE